MSTRYPELREAGAAELLPRAPQSQCYVRHTVGLGDPLTAGAIAAGEEPTADRERLTRQTRSV